MTETSPDSFSLDTYISRDGYGLPTGAPAAGGGGPVPAGAPSCGVLLLLHAAWRIHPCMPLLLSAAPAARRRAPPPAGGMQARSK